MFSSLSPIYVKLTKNPVKLERPVPMMGASVRVFTSTYSPALHWTTADRDALVSYPTVVICLEAPETVISKVKLSVDRGMRVVEKK